MVGEINNVSKGSMNARDASYEAAFNQTAQFVKSNRTNSLSEAVGEGLGMVEQMYGNQLKNDLERTFKRTGDIVKDTQRENKLAREKVEAASVSNIITANIFTVVGRISKFATEFAGMLKQS